MPYDALGKQKFWIPDEEDEQGDFWIDENDMENLKIKYAAETDKECNKEYFPIEKRSITIEVPKPDKKGFCNRDCPLLAIRWVYNTYAEICRYGENEKDNTTSSFLDKCKPSDPKCPWYEKKDK